MARSFNGSNQYLTNTNALVSSMPLTLACWFKTSDLDNDQVIMKIVDSDAFGSGYEMNFEPTNDNIRAHQYDDSGGGSFAGSTSAISSATWHHACAVFTSTTSRAAYLDGGSKGTNTNSRSAPTALDRTMIGADYFFGSPLSHVNGDVAEAAIWNTDLTDAEVAMLGAGYWPFLVRPSAIIGYWPLIGRHSPEVDIIGGYGMTLVNTPTASSHPPIIYTPSVQIGHAATGVSDVNISASDNAEVYDLTTISVEGLFNISELDDVSVSELINLILSAGDMIVSDDVVVGDSITLGLTGVVTPLGSKFPASLIGI